MKTPITMIGLAAIATFAVGCSFAARSPEMYRDDTRALLETKNPELKACYDAALKANPTVQGNVVVHFEVAEDTGTIQNIAVDPSSTAPQNVSDCVVRAIDGLTLDPPDERKGEATFTWAFTVGPQPAA